MRQNGFKLRDYQQEALNAIVENDNAGVSRQLVALATGTGKTIVFAHFPEVFQQKMLVIAHREELLNQARDKILQANPNLWVEIEQADRKASPMCDVVIASVATIGRAGSERLKKFDPDDFPIIVVDEAHHCHVPGTQILMGDNNYKSIEGIEVGDTVRSWDGVNWVQKRVVDKFVYWYDGPVIEIEDEAGRHVTVTPNHHLFQAGRKTKASCLDEGSTIDVPPVWAAPHELFNCPTSTVASSRLEALSRMWGNHASSSIGLAQKTTQARWPIVREMQSLLPPETIRGAQGMLRGRGVHQQSISQEGHDEAGGEQEIPCLPLRTHEEEKPHARSRSAGENAGLNKGEDRTWGTETLWRPTLGKGQASNPGRSSIFSTLSKCRIPSRISGWPGRGVSPLLHPRLHICRTASHRRGGWKQPSQIRPAPRSGPTQGSLVQSTQMASSAFQERVYSQQPIESHITSRKIRYYRGLIYDFTVSDTHNYIANGILSSNSVASTYMNVLEYFGVFNGSDKLLVGWTATPNRGDNVALNRVFQKIVYQKNLREMIEAGWLSPIRAYRVETESDLSNVHVRQGDFVSGELSFYLDENERNRLVVSSYLAYARGRKALVYAIDVEHAHHLAECFTAANIPAAAVSGKTPQDERHAMLEAFAAGDIQVLANCMILSEGYDQPDVGAIIMARPTMSGLLYAQQVGRGTRLAPGKEDVVVIDLVDNSKRHPLVTMPTLFGLSPEFNTQGKLLIDEVKRMEDLIEEYPHIPIDKATSIEDAQRLLREFDILGRAREVDEELVPYTPFVWASPSKDVYTMRMQNRDILTIQKNLLDQWEFRVTGHDPEAPWRVVARETVATSENKQDVFNEANGMIGEWYGNEEVLHARDARWKKDAATPKQVALLDKNRIPHPPNISKGEAGLLLDYHFSSRKRKT